ALAEARTAHAMVLASQMAQAAAHEAAQSEQSENAANQAAALAASEAARRALEAERTSWTARLEGLEESLRMRDATLEENAEARRALEVALSEAREEAAAQRAQ